MKKLIRLTEGDLHRIVKESVKRIINEGWTGRGYVSSDGNGMVGGYYGASESTASKDVLDDLLENMTEDISQEEFDAFNDYCEQNPKVFIIKAVISSSYDESTGYGSAYSPIMDFESTSGEEEALDYVSKYPNQKVAEVAVQVLGDILNNLDVEDFKIDADDFYGQEWEYDDD